MLYWNKSVCGFMPWLFSVDTVWGKLCHPTAWGEACRSRCAHTEPSSPRRNSDSAAAGGKNIRCNSSGEKKCTNSQGPTQFIKYLIVNFEEIYKYLARKNLQALTLGVIKKYWDVVSLQAVRTTMSKTRLSFIGSIPYQTKSGHSWGNKWKSRYLSQKLNYSFGGFRTLEQHDLHLSHLLGVMWLPGWSRPPPWKDSGWAPAATWGRAWWRRCALLRSDGAPSARAGGCCCETSPGFGFRTCRNPPVRDKRSFHWGDRADMGGRRMRPLPPPAPLGPGNHTGPE